MVRWGGRIIAVLAAFTFVFIALGFGPATANDDPDVIALDPAARAQTDVPPSRVTVAFTQNVRQDDATIVVKDSRGEVVSSGSFIIEGNNIYVDLAYNVPRGTYTVQYRATTTDGVPFGGSYQFAHGPGDFTDSAFSTWSGASDIPTDVRLPGDPDPTPDGDSATASPRSPGDADADPDSDSEGEDVDGREGGIDTTDRDGHTNPEDDSGASSSTWWWLLALVLLLLVAAGIAWRRGRGKTDV